MAGDHRKRKGAGRRRDTPAAPSPAEPGEAGRRSNTPPIASPAEPGEAGRRNNTPPIASPAEPAEAGRRNNTAVFAAGGAGVLLLGGLAIAVMKFSGDWSTPPAPLNPVTSPAFPSTSRSTQPPTIITPSDSTTSFTTSVSVSTTDIGVPAPEQSSSSSTDTTSPSSTPPTTTATTTTTTAPATTTAPPTTRASTPAPSGELTTTTRKRPRLNQTRTLSP